MESGCCGVNSMLVDIVAVVGVLIIGSQKNAMNLICC